MTERWQKSDQSGFRREGNERTRKWRTQIVFEWRDKKG